MSNEKTSQPKDELIDEVELPNDDDFSLAALDFLSADLTSEPAASDDFFDTDALTSLASLDWRDTDGTESSENGHDTSGTYQNGASPTDGVADEPVADTVEPQVDVDSEEVSETVDSPILENIDDTEQDALHEELQSMTSPTQDDDVAPAGETESFTQSVPDDADQYDLLELAESFTQSTPDEIDESLLELAELFTGPVPEPAHVGDPVDDEAPTVVLEPSADINALQAEIVAEIEAERAEQAASVTADTDASEEAVIAEAIIAPTAEGQDTPAVVAESSLEEAQSADDLLSIAEAATDLELDAIDTLPEEALAADETDEEIIAIAEAATESERSPFAFDEALLALAEDSAEFEDLFSDDELIDLAADDVLDTAEPTDAEFDALLDGDSRYLDQIVAGLDAEADHFAADEAQEIELLTSRQLLRDGEQYVVFALGETEYGIPVANVLEVGEPQMATPVPFVPHWVRGIINLRGEIVSLVDLRGFLHGTNGSDDGWMIISQTQDESVTVGLLVDDVRGNRHFHTNQQTALGGELEGVETRFLETVFKEDEGDMVAALDFEKLLNSAEMRQFEAI